MPRRLNLGAIVEILKPPSDDADWLECLACGNHFAPQVVDQDGRCKWCGGQFEREAVERAARLAALKRILGGDRAYFAFTFSQFQETPGNRRALEVAQRFDFRSDNLYLYGRNGTGKTHLACAIARGIFERGVGIEIVNSADLHAGLQPPTTGPERLARLEQLALVPCLVLQEVGMDDATDFCQSNLFSVLDQRQLAGRNGLIVTTNLSLADLGRRWQQNRLMSRLSELCPPESRIEITGPDWRNGRRS